MVELIKKHINHLLVFLLLVASGNPIWNQTAFSDINYIVFFTLLFLFFFFKAHYIITRFSKYVLPFVAIFLLQLLVVSGSSLSSSIFLLIKMFCGFSIILYLKHKFQDIYVDVMTFVAFISVICFGYTQLIGPLPGIQFSQIGVSSIVYTQISAFGVFLPRNAGMFWEPGAFQGYLNIAVAFLIMQPFTKNRLLHFLILTIAILTTKSTTGYAVFAFILLYYFLFIFEGPVSVKVFVIIAMGCIYIYAYNNLDFMKEKLETHQNLGANQEGRFNDYLRFSSLLIDNFFFGLSSSINRIVDTGNGFLSFLLYFGIMGFLYYFISLWRNLLKHGVRNACLLFAVIVLTLQGEGFIYYPCYLGLVALVPSDRYKIDNKNNLI